MTDLLPCPFCGCEPSVEMTGFHLGARKIYCASDDCMGPHTTAANLEDATLQWNNRAALPRLPAREEIARALKMVERVYEIHKSYECGEAIRLLSAILSPAPLLAEKSQP